MRLIILLMFNILLCNYNLAYSQTSEEQEMLDLVNNLRENRGFQPLRLNTALNQAAFNHSNDMAINDYFSHTGMNGSNFSQRSIDAGYTGLPRGENIAAGNSGVAATFNQWKNSSGHLNNMLNSNANEMGIGHAFDNSSTYGHYWTQIFGKGDQTLSSDDLTEVNQVTIYPNPIKGRFKIKLKNFSNTDEINIIILSISGQIVYEKSKPLVDNTITIDIQNLKNGIYFLYLKNAIKGYKIIKT